LLQFALTKSGKTRAVPIEEKLYKELMQKPDVVDSERLFKYSYSAFRDAIEGSKITLPRGAAYPCTAIHLCQSLYDEWREYSDFTENIRAHQFGHDHEICAPGARSSTGNRKTQPTFLFYRVDTWLTVPTNKKGLHFCKPLLLQYILGGRGGIEKPAVDRVDIGL
jgi:hypothetical protein